MPGCGRLGAGVVLCLACGCAARAQPSTAADANPQEHADPLPYIPRPTQAPSGETRALATLGGEAQARAVAHRFLRALLDGDSHALSHLMSPSVLRVRMQRRLPRAELIAHCLRHAQRLHFHPDSSVDEVVGIDRIRVTAVAEPSNARALSQGLRPADLSVRVPLHGANARSVPPPCLSHICVRAGPDPVIVAVHH